MFVGVDNVARYEALQKVFVHGVLRVTNSVKGDEAAMS